MTEVRIEELLEEKISGGVVLSSVRILHLRGIFRLLFSHLFKFLRQNTPYQTRSFSEAKRNPLADREFANTYTL